MDEQECDDWPACPKCGWDLIWEDCGACEDGQVDVYDEDPLWFDPGDTEDCAQCGGDGGWWCCPNPNCDTVVAG